MHFDNYEELSRRGFSPKCANPWVAIEAIVMEFFKNVALCKYQFVTSFKSRMTKFLYTVQHSDSLPLKCWGFIHTMQGVSIILGGLIKLTLAGAWFYYCMHAVCPLCPLSLTRLYSTTITELAENSVKCMSPNGFFRKFTLASTDGWLVCHCRNALNCHRVTEHVIFVSFVFGIFVIFFICPNSLVASEMFSCLCTETVCTYQENGIPDFCSCLIYFILLVLFFV